MIKNYQIFPFSLKVVFWLNLLAFHLFTLGGVFTFLTIPLSETISAALNAAFSLIVIVSIFARWNIVRVVVLILAWLSVIAAFFSLIALFGHVGFRVFKYIVPTSIALIAPFTTIWGLTTIPARRYYGLRTEKTEEEKYNEMFDLVGLEISEAEARLDRNFKYHSVEVSDRKQRFIYQSKMNKKEFLVLVVSQNTVEEIVESNKATA